MLFTPRLYQLSQWPDQSSFEPPSPFLRLRPSSQEQRAAETHAKKMLLVHQTGAVKVGELVRYTVTYEPTADRIVPTPSALHVRIKNTSAIPLRAAYLTGPYTLHVAAYPSSFHPNYKYDNPRRNGIPQFEPNLKAGAVFSAKLTVPEDLRIKSLADTNRPHEENRSVTWIIEITSQIIFSSSASVKFELLIGRDERSLEFNFTAVQPLKHPEPGQIQDNQENRRRRNSHGHHQRGVYSKAVSLVIDDTNSLWDRPPLPTWESASASGAGRKSTEHRRRKSLEPKRARDKKKQKMHLVILSHGLHSNIGTDMLYLKESIDATAKIAREHAQKRKEDAKRAKADSTTENRNSTGSSANDGGPSIAPLSGGQEDIPKAITEDDDSDDEEIIVRGFPGNVTKTENGIQYLGKRLARYILELTYPDQPVRFEKKKTLSKKFAGSFHSKKGENLADEGVPSHEGSRVRQETTSNEDLAYTFTSISFIGHSLGGLTQLYAIAYIQKHAPNFFEKIKPVNFVAMASPFLGLSNENPMYVRFALDFGLVGRTGQDLGLSWRAPTLAKSGWTAVVGGLGSGQKDQNKDDPGAKPLLRILPTGPAHLVLRKFRNRTVYSNVVNDGIVPLRTSCLLFLDWRGLDKVEKARRENGLVGTMIGWGWAEMMGQNTFAGESSDPVNGAPANNNDDLAYPIHRDNSEVPQPDESALHEDDDNASLTSYKSVKSVDDGRPGSRKNSDNGMGPLETLWNYIRPSGKTTKKDMRMFKRSQTLAMSDEAEEVARQEGTETHDAAINTEENGTTRPLASRGDSIENPNSHHAPPKTTIFESAADLLSPPCPPTSWIIDPASRARTIFHDRIYHPEDIPPPPMPKAKRQFTGMSLDSRNSTLSKDDSGSNSMRVEEKIARAYHQDLSWRKVLVRLEPDAHNNMIVRRMFANAYGWPVVKHMCDTHFADTFSARTRDEYEPATDRARVIGKSIDAKGERVAGQESSEPPTQPEHLMRKTTEEMKPLEEHDPDELIKKLQRDDSVEIDDSYLEDTDEEEEEARRSPFQRLWSPGPAPKSPGGSVQSPPLSPQVASHLTAEPAPLQDGSLANTSDLGLKKSVQEMIGGAPKNDDDGPEGEEDSQLSPTLSITEQILRSVQATHPT